MDEYVHKWCEHARAHLHTACLFWGLKSKIEKILGLFIIIIIIIIFLYNSKRKDDTRNFPIRRKLIRSHFLQRSRLFKETQKITIKQLDNVR